VIRLLVAVALIAAACSAPAAVPRVASVTPASATVGATVIIAGTNLGDARSVDFDGVSAVMVSITASRIVVRVPDGASTGPLSVATPSGTITASERFVVAPRPEIAGNDPVPPPTIETRTGYNFVSVTVARGTFGVHLIKERLSDVTVRTITANTGVCRQDCPAKPLAAYVAESRAYAGINGTYLCPPDYAECAGKVNTFDYAVYNSDLVDWINRPALITQNGLVTFAGHLPTFYRRSHVFGQDRVLSRAPITAGLTMYPLLVQAGVVIDSEREQNAVQMQRTTKGAIGADAIFLYLVLINNATVTDSAYVLQALGVRDALNLDGGGTSAMWIGGSYKVGPGRLLPNAILLTKP